MSLSESERRDYETLTSRLSQRFGSSKHQNLWLFKFENRRRMRGESIISLADDIWQLAQKAYADLDSIAVERLALNQLYNQISGDMHFRCIDNNCHTVNDAVSVIERYEAILCNPQSTPAAPWMFTMLHSMNHRFWLLFSGSRPELNILKKYVPIVPLINVQCRVGHNVMFRMQFTVAFMAKLSKKL